MKAFPTKPIVASALAALIAACGGNSDDVLPADTPSQQTRSLALSGTAATGLALPDSAVDVKCATGTATATATTDGNGRYTLRITDGALPCMIRVTGTVNGASVSLHSLVEAGSTVDGMTTAVANVSPLTEMIVAQLAAKLPSELFASFGSGSTVTADQIKAASDAVLGVLKDVTGIDLSATDPFKAPLVAATSANLSGGNSHDQLLDAVGAIFPLGSLSVVTNEIVKSASPGGGGTTGLSELVTSVNSGAMPGCAGVKSGDYRSMEYFGATAVNHVDFKAMTFQRSGQQTADAIQALDPAKPCEFVVMKGTGNDRVEFRAVMGPSGSGAFRSHMPADSTDPGTVAGYFFPAQKDLKLNDLAGDWTTVESGEFAGDGLLHTFTKLSFSGSDISQCVYDNNENPGCMVLPTGYTATLRSDGGFDMSYMDMNTPVVGMQLYGWRAPDGAIALYGTTNAAGAASSPNTLRTTTVATRRTPVTAWADGAVLKSWDLVFTSPNGSALSTLTSESRTVARTSNAFRSQVTRASDGHVDDAYDDTPLPGLRWFGPGTQLVLPGGVSINYQSTDGYSYTISTVRP